MAVQSDTSRIQYAGNNSTTTSYAVPFVFLENSHLQAIARTSAGVETAVALTNHTGAGDVNGGTVQTAVAVPATSTLTIFRVVPTTQTTQYQEGGDFPAASHERALDKLTQIAQQLKRNVESSVRMTDAVPLAPLVVPTGSTPHVLTTVNGGAPTWETVPSVSTALNIPALTNATTVNADDELIIQQAGIAKRATANELLSSQYALKWSTWRPRYSTDQEAFEAMLVEIYDFSGPTFIDLEGNTVTLTAPVYVSSVTNRTTYSNYHSIMNGTLLADASWPRKQVIATNNCTAAYAAQTLTMTSTVGLWAGMHCSSAKLPLGTYISSVDSATQVSINTYVTEPLASDPVVFTQHHYMLNWLNKSDGSAGFTQCSRLYLRNIQFAANRVASCILLPYAGIQNHINNCVFLNFVDRCMVDANGAVAAMSFTNNEVVPNMQTFTVTISNANPAVVTRINHRLDNGDVVEFSSTGSLPSGISAGTLYFVRDVTDDTFRVAASAGGAAIATTTSGNGVHTAAQITNQIHSLTFTGSDVKVRNNRITTCRHHMIFHGTGVLVVGNHWWGGGFAGCVFTRREYKSVITGNYIDNNWIELSDENGPDADARQSINGITITGNIFTWAADFGFSSRQWLRLAPHTANTVLPVTISNATPAVLTSTAHGLIDGQTIRLNTTGTLPSGLVANTDYQVVSATANTFSVSERKGGTALNTTTAGSGTHSITGQRYVADLAIIGNTFKRLANAPAIARMDTVDNSEGLIDEANCEGIVFVGNAFEGVGKTTENPATMTKTVSSGSATNNISFGFSGSLPFGADAMTVVSATLRNAKDSGGATAYPAFMFYSGHDLLSHKNIQMRFGSDVSGTATVTASINNAPISL